MGGKGKGGGKGAVGGGVPGPPAAEDTDMGRGNTDTAANPQGLGLCQYSVMAHKLLFDTSMWVGTTDKDAGHKILATLMYSYIKTNNDDASFVLRAMQEHADWSTTQVVSEFNTQHVGPVSFHHGLGSQQIHVVSFHHGLGGQQIHVASFHHELGREIVDKYIIMR